MFVILAGSDRAEHITVCWALNMANLAVSECRNLIECCMKPEGGIFSQEETFKTFSISHTRGHEASMF